MDPHPGVSVLWSPDGALLSVVNDMGDAGERLYVVGADGSNVRPVAESDDLLIASWSPDGRLAYAEGSQADGQVRIWVAPADGADPLEIGSVPFGGSTYNYMCGLRAPTSRRLPLHELGRRPVRGGVIMPRHGRSFALAIVVAIGACSSATESADAPSPPETSSAAVPAEGPKDIMEFIGSDPLGPIEAGTYSIDPDLDPSTPLRVTYEVPDGWSNWIGAAKFSDAGHVGVSITTVSNLVTHGCRDHSWADPPVGPSVDDLVTGLEDLPPFRVTSPSADVSAYGYRGTHLGWSVPKDQPLSEDETFTGCEGGELKSWVAAIDVEPRDAFYGYTGPGYTEEFWILDVDGTRLMIAAERSPGSPPEDVEEMHAVLDSIRVEP
jgi:hypothetical protein